MISVSFPSDTETELHRLAPAMLTRNYVFLELDDEFDFSS